jgi:hypothetical protein
MGAQPQARTRKPGGGACSAPVGGAGACARPSARRRLARPRQQQPLPTRFIFPSRLASFHVPADLPACPLPLSPSIQPQKYTSQKNNCLAAPSCLSCTRPTLCHSRP